MSLYKFDRVGQLNWRTADSLISTLFLIKSTPFPFQSNIHTISMYLSTFYRLLPKREDSHHVRVLFVCRVTEQMNGYCNGLCTSKKEKQTHSRYNNAASKNTFKCTQNTQKVFIGMRTVRYTWKLINLTVHERCTPSSPLNLFIKFFCPRTYVWLSLAKWWSWIYYE